MIKPTELRIGNLLNHKLNNVTIMVSDIGINRFICIDGAVSYSDTYAERIPLTAVWLTKLGFSWYDTGEEYCLDLQPDSDVLDGAISELCWTGNHLWIYPTREGSICLPHIKYVHQLQNLYFSLTGKELILNNGSI